jgi:hypothetical protein
LIFFEKLLDTGGHHISGQRALEVGSPNGFAVALTRPLAGVLFEFLGAKHPDKLEFGKTLLNY